MRMQQVFGGVHAMGERVTLRVMEEREQKDEMGGGERLWSRWERCRERKSERATEKTMK